MFENYKDTVELEELMEMIGCSRGKALGLIAKGEVESRLVRHRHRISKKSVIAYVSRRKR